ncbi:MAG: hypothetical protein JNL82_15330 [Myxococcales bacterium]|nr:hypothetical protein [Myxococcales bacterium]
MRPGHHRLLLASLALPGCVEQIYADSIAEFPPKETTSSGTTEPPTPTTTDPAPVDPGVQTATGASSEDTGAAETTTSGTTTSGTTTGPPENQPPKIDTFDASVYFLDEAGPLTLMLTASDDHAVVKVRLFLDGEELESNLNLADFPYVYDVLSAKYNGAQRKFKVVVEDAEGLTDERETDPITLTLPQPGVERCYFEDPDKGAVISVISAIEYTPEAIFAVGTRALKLAVWKLDPDDCSLVPGWPKTIANWTGDDGFKGLTSLGAAVDEDVNGNIIVGGNFLNNGKLQAYVALLTDDGARLWERAGAPGDELAGVAAALYQHSHKVFVGGSVWTNDNPVQTDAAVWIYHFDGDSVFVAPPTTLRAPFTPDEFDPDLDNLLVERVRAIAVQPGTGYAIAVGEREFKPDVVNVYDRTFAVRVQPTGGIVGMPWTSTADASFVHDAGQSITVCEDGFLVGGWTRDEAPAAEPNPMIFWFDKTMALDQRRAEPQLFATEIHGIACDRENKVVSAGSRQVGSDDTRVFTVLGLLDPRITYDNGVPGDDAAGAVACDPRGFCGWGGYRTANLMPYAVARVHHP